MIAYYIHCDDFLIKNFINPNFEKTKEKIFLDIEEAQKKLLDGKKNKQHTLDNFNFKFSENNLNKNKNMKIMEKDTSIKIYSWNINGFRSIIESGALDEFFKKGKSKIHYLFLLI